METISRNPSGPSHKPLAHGLNSKALAAYARRAVWRANGSIVLYGAFGALSGYSLVMLYNSYAALVILSAGYGLRLPNLPLLPYLDVALPVFLAILFALFAANKAEEARFKSQLALHILHLQELLERDKD